MNSLPYFDLARATRLTRTGDLFRAAALMQRALRGAMEPAGRNESNARRDAAPTADRETVPDAPNHGQFVSLWFKNAAGMRAYKLFIPRGYDGRPRPLIVMLHGCTQTPDDFAAGTRMNALADERTFFVAYPEQPASANAAKCWNWFEPSDQQRDRGEPSLVAGITRKVMEEYAIDRKRVYVAGMSAGAAAAAVLAYRYPDLFAALGVHSGLACGIADDLPSALAAMRNGDAESHASADAECAAKHRRPVPTIVFHGDRDTTVNPRNADRFVANIASVACEKRVATGRVQGGRAFTQTSYTDRGGRRVLEQWAIHDAGHAWSGGSRTGSYTDPHGPDASREIVRFFLSHRHSD